MCTRLALLGLLLVPGALAEEAAFGRTGVPNEVLGVYVGEEKFPVLNDEGGIDNFRFCSRVIVQEREGFRLYVTAEGTCEQVGVDQVGGSIDGDWFGQIAQEFIFIENIDGWECTPTSECVDVISNPDPDDPTPFDNYELVAKSCGRQLKNALNQDVPWSCDAWQINLLKKEKYSYKYNDYGYHSKGYGYHGKGGKGGSGGKKGKGHRALEYYPHDDDEYLVVLTLTYSNSFETREELVEACPGTAIYRSQDILDDEFGVGAIQFVVQQSVEGNDLMDPCNWDCYEDTDGVCNNV